MTARDFSVMPVLVVDQERVSLARAVRSHSGSTRVGDRVDVEFGATWATVGGKPERVPGTWRECRIVRVVHSELHVELLAAQRTTQVTTCYCDEGWVCETHHDQPAGHGCGAAGAPCLNVDCPWWQGTEPAARNTLDIKASTREEPRPPKKSS